MPRSIRRKTQGLVLKAIALHAHSPLGTSSGRFFSVTKNPDGCNLDGCNLGGCNVGGCNAVHLGGCNLGVSSGAGINPDGCASVSHQTGNPIIEACKTAVEAAMAKSGEKTSIRTKG